MDKNGIVELKKIKLLKSGNYLYKFETRLPNKYLAL